MSPERAAVPYAELLSELGRLCAAKRTGTMFIATTDNQSARIGLRQGDIISLVFRTQRGLEAIDRIRKITAGRFTFSDTVVDRVASADLPATADLLSLLDANGAAPTIPAASASPPRPPDAAPRLVAPPPPQAAASPELVKAQAVIEAELTEFVGPIAPLLCRGHITRAAAAGSPLDLPALVEAVAREIGDRAKEDRFTQQTLARLREP
jgi:hypothetical protein